MQILIDSILRLTIGSSGMSKEQWKKIKEQEKSATKGKGECATFDTT